MILRLILITLINLIVSGVVKAQISIQLNNQSNLPSIAPNNQPTFIPTLYTNDKPFESKCPKGSFITEIIARGGSGIDRLSWKCSDGSFSVKLGTSLGGNNFPVLKSQSGFVKAVFTDMTSFEIGCKTSPWIGAYTNFYDANNTVYNIPGRIRQCPTPTFVCPPNQVFTGFSGRCGVYLTQVYIAYCDYPYKTYVPTQSPTISSLSTSPSILSPCKNGFYRILNSPNNSCIPCEKGAYSLYGAASCTLCPMNTYSNTEASSSCYPCQTGTYTSTIGSTVCQSIITKDTFCRPFSASNTFWGTRNSPICKIRACAGDTLKLSTVTGGGFCREDTYAILKNSTGAIVSIGDDFINPSFYCSEVLYTVPLLNAGQGSTPQCQDYTLVQGCYSYNCSGQYNVQIRNAFNMPYTYIGCYGDVSRINYPNATDAMIYLSYNSLTKTIDDCFDLANSMGYTYFGLLGGGGSCLGSNDLTRATQYGKCPYSSSPDLAGTVCDCNKNCVYGDLNCGNDLTHSLFQIFSFAKALSIVPSRKPTFKPTAAQAITAINLNCTILGVNLTSFILSSSPHYYHKCFVNNLGTYLFDIPVCGVPSPISCTGGVFPSGTMSSLVTINSGTYDGNTWSIGVYQNKPSLMVFYQNGDVFGNEPLKSKVVIVCNSLLTTDRITQSNTRPFHAVVIMETPNHDICNSNIPAPFVPYTYVGCYGNTASYAMTLLYERLFSSPRECRDYTLAKNYRYFALSFNVLVDNQFQCYGSNDLVASTKYGACATGSTGTVKNCVCSQSCENGEDCGGVWAITIYEIWYPPTFAPTMAPTLPTISPTLMPSTPTFSPSFLPTAVPTQLYTQEWKVRVTSSLHTTVDTGACHVVEMTATGSDARCELVSAMLACQSHVTNYLATTQLPGRVKLICNVYMDVFTSPVLMNVALASDGAFLNFLIYEPDFHPTHLVDVNINLYGNKNVIVGGNTYRFIAANIVDNNEKITLSLYDLTLQNFGNAALLSDGGAMNLKSAYNNLNLYLNAVNVIRCQSSTNGGGLTLLGLSSVIILNSTFSDNSANSHGGAIYAARSNVVITNSVIQGNNANQNGGGLYFLNAANSQIMSTTITKNTASLNGGGVFILSTSQLNINTDTLCSQNIALIGGCIYVQRSSNIKIANSLFTSNTAAGNKGAGFYVTDSSRFQLISSTITKNSITSATRSDLSGAGAGIFLINSPNALLSNLMIVANLNPPSGGGAYIFNCSYIKFENSFIGSNQAYYQGGGVHMENSMYAIFVNNTWTDNQVSSVAAAVYVYNSNFIQFVQSTVNDNIAGGDSGGLYFEKCFNVTLSHCVFNGNTGSGGGALTMVDNTYFNINNIATNSNNGYRGGGVNMFNCRFTRVSNSNFFADKAVWGGAFFIDNCVNTTLSDIRINKAVSVNKGSGVYAQFSSGLSVSDSTITGCNAAIGAGLYVFTSTNTLIDNATITLNAASDLSLGGGGVFFDHCTTGVIQKSTIFSNSARNGGGGCYIYFSDRITIISTMLSDNDVLGNGGGLLVQSSDNFKLSDSDVISNKVNNLGGGLYITSSTSFTTTRTNFKTNFAMGSSGGGIYISQCSQVVLEMSTFNSNSAPNNNGAGGALYITLSDQLKFNKLDLQNNFAEGNGGGIFVSFSGPLQILSCYYNKNEVHANGAAVYVTSNTPSSNTIISGNIFTSNRAVLNGGALFIGSSKSIVLADNIFNENSVSSITDGSGGGAYLTLVQNTVMKNNSFQSIATGAAYGSGIYMLNSQNVTVSQSQISQHKAIQGAGMFVSLCSGLVIKNSVFTRNTASKFGGGFFIDKSTISFSRVSITNNYATVSGGGVYSATQSNLNFDSTNLTFNVASGGGSIFMNTRIKSVIKKSIFHSNQATTGGGGSIKAMDSCDVAISDTTFLNEKCQLEGGAIDIISNSKLNILRSTFTSCSSLSGLGDGGGALYIGTNISSMIDSSTFTQNSANKCGAVSYTNTTKFTILNSNFNNNKAKVYGGSLCLVNAAIGLINTTVFASSNAGTGGGAIYFNRVKTFLPAVVITYSTFSTNLAKYGSALYFGASYTSLNPPTVTSNLFKDNKAYAGGTFFLEDISVSNPVAVAAYTKEAVTTTSYSKTKLIAVAEEKLMDNSFITLLSSSNTFVNNVAPYGALVASSPAQLKYSTFSSSTSNDVSQIITVNENNGIVAFPSFTILDAFGTVVSNVTYVYQVNVSSSSINSKTACSPGSIPAGKVFGEISSKESVFSSQRPVQILNVKAHCYPNRTMAVKVSVVFPDLKSSLWTIFALKFLPCPNKFIAGSNDVCVPIESQPSYFPSLNTLALASANDSALSTNTVIGIVVSCVIVLILLILFIYGVTYSMNKAKHKPSHQRRNADYIQNRLGGDTFSSSSESIVYVNGLKSFRLSNTESMNSSFTTNELSASESESGGPLVLYVPYIDWNDVEMVDNRKDKVIIGKGSYGSVIKAKVNTKTEHGELAIPDDQVVIKIMDKSLLPAYDIDNHHKNLTFAMNEVKVLLDAEARIVHKDCIIKVYGIAVGNLPVALSDFFNVADYTNAIGIVMRYESGGSLNSLIHRNNSSSSICANVSGADLLLTSGRDDSNENEGSTDSNSSQCSSTSNMSIVEKIRILSLISKGLAELHSVGIVHGDIKPDNILLSHHNPPQVRLADFGLASLREDKGDGGLGQSTLIVTEHARGTPIYCAPEMLINVHVPNFKISKASRKTDMYAFAILMWEVITEKRPFHWVKDEVTLCSIVHQGGRPAITDISGTKYPDKIKNLITSTWDHDRAERKTAIECFVTLQYCHGYLAETDYDVYLLCHPSDTFVSNHIFHRLMQNGLNVQQSNELTTQQGISKSKIVIACLNEKFQADESCQREVKSARETVPRRPVIALFLQLDQDKWVDGDTYYTCQMRDASTITFDISNVLSQSPPSLWNEEGPDKESKIIFHNEIDRLTDYIKKRIGFF